MVKCWVRLEGQGAGGKGRESGRAGRAGDGVGFVSSRTGKGWGYEGGGRAQGGASKALSVSLTHTQSGQGQVTESQQVTKAPAASSLWATSRHGVQPLGPGTLHTTGGTPRRSRIAFRGACWPSTAASVEKCDQQVTAACLGGCVRASVPSQRQHQWSASGPLGAGGQGWEGKMGSSGLVTLRFSTCTSMYGAGLGMD